MSENLFINFAPFYYSLLNVYFAHNTIIGLLWGNASVTIQFRLGFILIFSSGSIGQKKGDNAVASNGGMMDTSQYERIIESTTNNFRTTGLILSLIGGVGFLISGYAL